jgi:hypothetical protein
MPPDYFLLLGLLRLFKGGPAAFGSEKNHVISPWSLERNRKEREQKEKE